jgi:hypothetical protein
MINRVRAAVKSIPVGAMTDTVRDILGAPDERTPGLSGYLAAETVDSVNELQSLVTLETPTADETWMYVNPYRATIMHYLAFSNGKLRRTWEFREAAERTT